MIDLRNNMPSEYDYNLDDLNWRDDGDELSDPSMNDFYMSYNKKGMDDDAYKFPQWAKQKKKNIRKAAMEVINMHFYPEFLADYILTLWNGVDGSLQDFYEGFTLRYNNNLKKAIAKHLKQLGYTVYPVLTDDRAFYAKRVKTIMRCASKKDLKTKLCVAKALFNSEALNLCIGEIQDIEEMGKIKVTAGRALDMLDYYQQIFPTDYAIVLTSNLINNKKPQTDDYGTLYHDYNLTNESLKQVENMLSGNRDPIDSPYSMGQDYGYDYVTKMRGFDGVKPEQYEIRASLKKKIVADEDIIGKIPRENIRNALNEATQNIKNDLNLQVFETTPTRIRQIRVQKNYAENKFPNEETVKPQSLLKVYDLYRLIDKATHQEYFIVISAICKINRYNKTEWGQGVYEGWFDSIEQAMEEPNRKPQEIRESEQINV